MAESPWTELKMERLTEYWTQGMPTREIADLLGTSRNAVVGKARRLRLPQHPDAKIYVPGGRVKRAVAPRMTAPKIAAKISPDAGRCERRAAPKMPMKLHEDAAIVAALPGANDPLPESRLLQLFDLPRVGMCRWPIGDVGKPGFAFCAADCAPSRSYCETHHRLSRGSGSPSERRVHLVLSGAA